MTALSYDSASFEWTPVTGAAAYEMSIIGINGGRGQQVYLTKGTKLALKGLSPDTYYSFTVWAFNASGYSGYPESTFNTPSKPKP